MQKEGFVIVIFTRKTFGRCNAFIRWWIARYGKKYYVCRYTDILDYEWETKHELHPCKREAQIFHSIPDIDEEFKSRFQGVSREIIEDKDSQIYPVKVLYHTDTGII